MAKSLVLPTEGWGRIDVRHGPVLGSPGSSHEMSASVKMPCRSDGGGGGAAGIGKATALRFAEDGAKVIICDLNETVGQETVKLLGEKAAFYKINVANRAEVQAWIEDVVAKYGRIDVLVNNAGVVRVSRQESVDGIEMTWAVNHLHYFLLTNLLLDALTASAPSRIVNVSSALHKRTRIAFDDLQFTRAYNPEIWRTLEALGIGKLVVQGAREREFANLYRAHDAGRALTDKQFAQVLAFVNAAFELALGVVDQRGTTRDAS